MVKDKLKIILQMIIIIVLIITRILWNKLKCTTTKEIEQTKKIPQNGKLIWLRRDIHIDTENKIPFHKFSTKLHIQ